MLTRNVVVVRKQNHFTLPVSVHLVKPQSTRKTSLLLRTGDTGEMSLSLCVCVPPQKAGFMLLESAFASEPGDRRNVIIIVSHIRAGTMAGNGQMMYM